MRLLGRRNERHTNMKCKTDGCETTMSEGAPEYCPDCQDKRGTKTQATFFKEEIENSIKRYGTMTVYETIGALEVVKQNLLDRLGRM